MDHPDLVTLCGRYGLWHGENFLRRRSAKEPVEAPRRYYSSDKKFKEGKASSSTAWLAWKNEHYGNKVVERTPWFELADHDLREINRLISSQNKPDFAAGLKRLKDKVVQSEQASENLQRASKTTPGWLVEQWQDQVRQGPPVLSGIAKHLQDDSYRQKAIQMLADICDDKISAKTFRPAMSGQQTATPQRHESSNQGAISGTMRPTHQNSRPTLPIQTALTPKIRMKSHYQGDKFDLGYDPGEHVEGTARPGNMFAPSRMPNYASNHRTARPSGQGENSKITAPSTSHTRPKTTEPFSIAPDPPVQLNSHHQGESFDLGYDPGEHVQATVKHVYMFAPSTAPGRASKQAQTKKPHKSKE